LTGENAPVDVVLHVHQPTSGEAANTDYYDYEKQSENPEAGKSNEQTESKSSGGLELDSKGRPKMGAKNKDCDDGKQKIQKDLHDQEKSTKCNDKNAVSLKSSKDATESDLKGIGHCNEIDKDYVPAHHCMNETIDYDSQVGTGRIPTHASHRPNWAKFGEYSYCPAERYQHNIEHGCIILLYHPCLADSEQLEEAKQIVKGCIRKHIITPSSIPTPEHPMVLVAWGCYVEMNTLDRSTIETFIKKHGAGAGDSPEGTFPKDGKYDHLITHIADIPKGSDNEDNNLCPQS